MITLLFDGRYIILQTLKSHGFDINSKVLQFSKAFTGYGIKFFTLYVLWIQEKGRIVRWIYFEQRKYDSGSASYNIFMERHPMIDE